MPDVYKRQGVYFTDIGQKLIAQSLALAGALYQTGNINELDHCGSDLAGIVHIGKKTETKIRYGNQMCIRDSG